MTRTMDQETFDKSHPHPDKCGIKSLFRFYKIGREDYLRHLFIDRKLYHSLPSQFNDPFECNPHFSLHQNDEKIRSIKQYLINLFMQMGRSEIEAEAIVSQKMENPEFIETTISDAVTRTYAQLRICSFTTRKENLLFWSHYADSHRGFCLEFDATKMPISYAFKVKYENRYPEAIYPSSYDANTLIPALVKSEAWGYEEEFRTILVPWADTQPDNDSESLNLKGDEIKNIYFGSKIDEDKKKLIMDLIKDGELKPGVWMAHLAKSSFSLEFEKVD